MDPDKSKKKAGTCQKSLKKSSLAKSDPTQGTKRDT